MKIQHHLITKFLLADLRLVYRKGCFIAFFSLAFLFFNSFLSFFFIPSSLLSDYRFLFYLIDFLINVLALFFAFLTLFPPKSLDTSFLYKAVNLECSYSEYVEKNKLLTTEEMLRDIDYYNYALSSVVFQKRRFIKTAIILNLFLIIALPINVILNFVAN